MKKDVHFGPIVKEEEKVTIADVIVNIDFFLLLISITKPPLLGIKVPNPNALVPTTESFYLE